MINNKLEQIEEEQKNSNIAKIINILAYQQSITNQGNNYTGEKDWALNKILSLLNSSIIRVLQQLVEREEKEIKDIKNIKKDYGYIPSDQRQVEYNIYNHAKQDTIDYLKSEIANLSTNIDKE